MTALVISGACCLVSPLFFGAAPGWVLLLGIVWGAAVIADSGVFSTSLSEVADPRYVGTALTAQTAIGFALTVVTIQLVPVLAEVVGWRWAFWLLVPGPVVGAFAMRAFGRSGRANPWWLKASEVRFSPVGVLQINQAVAVRIGEGEHRRHPFHPPAPRCAGSPRRLRTFSCAAWASEVPRRIAIGIGLSGGSRTRRQWNPVAPPRSAAHPARPRRRCAGRSPAPRCRTSGRRPDRRPGRTRSAPSSSSSCQVDHAGSRNSSLPGAGLPGGQSPSTPW